MRNERRVARWAAAIAMVTAIGSAQAQESSPDRTAAPAGRQGTGDVDAAPVKPWSRGVPMAQREAARELFLEGNRYLDVPLFAQAAEKYQEALALWPHPAFHFNLALAQLNLVQPVEAYESFDGKRCSSGRAGARSWPCRAVTCSWPARMDDCPTARRSCWLQGSARATRWPRPIPIG